MANLFHDVSVSVFDVHTAFNAVAPGVDGRFQQRFGFLRDSQSYKEFYDHGNDINISGFGFRPLTKGELTSNHFWNQYSLIALSQGIGFWSIQLPIVCNPKNTEIRFNVPLHDVTVTIRPRIHLSTIGWSTSIRIGLRSKGMAHAQLLEILQGAMGNTDVPAFSIAGVATTLTGIFQFFQKKITDVVYETDVPPHPPMKIPRHFVVAINHFSGSVKYYRNAPAPSPAMTKADRARMQSLLWGQKIDVSEEGQRPAMLTRMKKENFALTNFDHGTLVFAQRDALDISKTKKLHCLASNIHNSIMMAFFLAQFHNNSTDAESTTLMGRLHKVTEDTLKKMPGYCQRPFFETMVSNHGVLSTIAGESDDQSEE